MELAESGRETDKVMKNDTAVAAKSPFNLLGVGGEKREGFITGEENGPDHRAGRAVVAVLKTLGGTCQYQRGEKVDGQG